MAEPTTPDPDRLPSTTPAAAVAPSHEPTDASQALGARWVRLRGEIHPVVAVLLSVSCIALCFAAWWFVTRGETEEDRIVSATSLPSPAETFSTFKSLWFDRALTRNLLVTLKRVTLGFALALAVGVPLGVLAGCFASVRAFLAPLVIFGRNIPIAALIGLTFVFFGIGETQKVMFIFFACVAFVLADTTASIIDVGQQYVDTAYTLGASRWQAIIKVLVPLALPSVFNSARLLFGLAFGYVMLAELVRMGSEAGGLGNLINVSMRQGPRAHVYLIVLIIPAVALGIDRLLYIIQRSLFPYRYGGAGMLNTTVRMFLHGWDDLKGLVFKRKRAERRLATGPASTPKPEGPA
jgi:ABC-type nitrate/sulfonate/bicarbonate transport system permease component